MIHQDVLKELKFSTIQEWKEALASIPEDEYGWIEWQGYALAGLILVPAAPLQVAFQDKIKVARNAGLSLLDIDEHGRRTVESNIARSVFEVSAEVIARRMDKEKLWG